MNCEEEAYLKNRKEQKENQNESEIKVSTPLQKKRNKEQFLQMEELGRLSSEMLHLVQYSQGRNSGG